MLFCRWTFSQFSILKSNISWSKSLINYRWKSNVGAVEIDTKEHIYVHRDYVNQLVDHRSYGVRTAYDILCRSKNLYSNRILFSHRTGSNQSFQHMTYHEVFELIHQIGSGIIHLGLKKSNKTFIGIYGSSNVHYALVLYSAWPYSMVPVGIYDSLSQDSVRFIIEKSELKLIFADHLSRVQTLIDLQHEKSPLKIIITLNSPTKQMIEQAQSKNLQLITYEELIDLGKQNLSKPSPPSLHDLALIMFTSGSTGYPKGCLITHDNLICSVIGISLSIDLISLSKTEIIRVLNFMPLAHMFGCGTTVIFTYLGGEVGFWQGSVDRLMDDFRDFKPTILTMVPRLLNKLHERVHGEIKKKGFVIEYLFSMGIQRKNQEIEKGIFSTNTIWDKLFFKKIRSSFGGQVKRVVSSSSSLSFNVAQLSRAIFSCFFIEGYGQTECITGTWQTVHDQSLNQVGIPTPVNQIKLIDVPEMNYFSKNSQGEICIRGHAVFQGYLNEPKQTEQILTKDGWLLTGDIGQWTKNNHLQIIDRKKNLFKLSHGEYIAPEKLEEIYGQSQWISQLFIDGKSSADYLVALIVLDKTKENQMMKLIHDKSSSSSIEQILIEDFQRILHENKLRSYEMIQHFTIIDQPFTIENGFLTPTFKYRRHLIRNFYQKQLQQMYQQPESFKQI